MSDNEIGPQRVTQAPVSGPDTAIEQEVDELMAEQEDVRRRIREARAHAIAMGKTFE